MSFVVWQIWVRQFWSQFKHLHQLSGVRIDEIVVFDVEAHLVGVDSHLGNIVRVEKYFLVGLGNGLEFLMRVDGCHRFILGI